MNRWRWAAGALALGLMLTAATSAEARVPMTRTAGQKSTGSRNDMTVPYTTNGKTAFGVYNGVAPKIYASPVVDDPSNPQSKPVFNLIFWGSVQSFGDKSNGAIPRSGQQIR